MNKLLDRFSHYVSVESQSKVNVRQLPRSEGQLGLAQILCEELGVPGMHDIRCYVRTCLLAARTITAGMTLPRWIIWIAPYR